MPTAAIRRPVTVTAWLLMSITALALSPLLLVVGAVASAVIRRPQPLLLARLVIAYFARELGVLVACGLLWLAPTETDPVWAAQPLDGANVLELGNPAATATSIARAATTVLRTTHAR